MGQSVFANSASSHSILFCSSGMFTLMAAWQAMEAAMRARIFSRFRACSSRENWSSSSCSMCSTARRFDSRGSDFHRDAARAEGLGFKSVVLQFVGDFGEYRLLRRGQFQHQGMSRRWLSTFCAARCFSIVSNSTRSWATCWSTIQKPS